MAEPTLNLSIAPVHDVAKDLRRNKLWIISIIVLWLLFIFISAGAACIWEDWSYLRSCYFTVINTTTVGFGDVTPSTWQTKILAGVNSVVGLVLFGGLIATITMALQPTSYSGSVVLPAAAGTTESSAVAGHDFGKELLQAVGRLLTLAKKETEAEEKGAPKEANVDILMHRDDGPPGAFIHIRIRCRAADAE